MPSTLYESVKQSVIEYTQIKKRNQRKQDKLIFRWKLITLGLAIVLIVLIGLFSQFLASINKIPDVNSDKTYLLSLLEQTTDQFIPTVSQTSYLLNGFYLASNKYGANFEWNKVQKLYSTTNQINLAPLLAAIKDKQELLFLFSNPNIPTLFGLRAHQGYSGYQTNAGVTTVQDDSESRYSSVFNYINGNTMMTFDAPNCNLFSATSSTLTLFESITLNNANSAVLFNVTNANCFFAADYNAAQKYLLSLIGITGPIEATSLTGFGLEVYRLYLSQNNDDQI